MNRLPTLYGIIAILLWSMSVALTRGLAEALGPFGADRLSTVSVGFWYG